MYGISDMQIYRKYMIYDGKIHGASAVLLICSLLDEYTIRKYIEICDSLGMSALVEAHDEEEIEKIYDALKYQGIEILIIESQNSFHSLPQENL